MIILLFLESGLIKLSLLNNGEKMSFRLIYKSDFDKVKSYNGDWAVKMQLFADMCRYNTLVAVKKAGSGHLGSSLSAMDITTYLYLNELNIFVVDMV